MKQLSSKVDKVKYNITWYRKDNLAYIKFRNAKVKFTEEIIDGVFVDFDKNDKSIGVEIINATMDLDDILKLIAFLNKERGGNKWNIHYKEGED